MVYIIDLTLSIIFNTCCICIHDEPETTYLYIDTKHVYRDTGIRSMRLGGPGCTGCANGIHVTNNRI